MSRGKCGARWGLLAASFALAFFLAAELEDNVEKAVFRYASASRNPYLYMHTTPRYPKLLERLDAVGDEVGISVYSPDAAWPLPWHLRGREQVGYWATIENLPKDGISLIDTRLLEGREDVTRADGFWELHGLRPNTLLALRASDEVAQQWMNANAKD